MSAQEPAILRGLAAIGVQVVLVDGKLRARGATSRLTSAHLAAIRQQRAKLRVWLATDRSAQVIPFVPGLLGGDAPNPMDWARYFTRFPEELVRLTANVDVVPQWHLPTGRSTTSRHWAAYFHANPAEFDRLSTLAAERVQDLAAKHAARGRRHAETSAAPNGAIVPRKVF